MRKEYPYLHNPYNESLREFTDKEDFLQEIDSFLNQRTYVKVTLLDWSEQPLKEIQGILTSGSLTKNGASSVRRTCNFSATISGGAFEVEDLEMDFSINKKIFLEIGIKNDAKSPLYPPKDYPIFWFPQGVFFIKSVNISSSANSAVNLSLSLGDKMLGLNGEVGGNFTATTVLDEVDTQTPSGEFISEKVRVHDIIQEVVHHFGGEDLNNIVIEDVPLRIKKVMKWRGDRPLYYITHLDEDGTWTEVSLIEPPEGTHYEMYINGQDVGYIYDDFVYTSELTAANGDSVCSVLDKIKNYLGNYEYFYDEYGIFHFREIKNYLNTTQATVVDEDMKKFQNSDEQYFVDITTGKSVYNFKNNQNIISINQNPQYSNIKNDYVIEGLRKMTGTDISYPVRYHLAIDHKPETGNEYFDVLIYKEEGTEEIKLVFPRWVEHLPETGDMGVIYKSGTVDSDALEEYYKNKKGLDGLYTDLDAEDENIRFQEKYIEVLGIDYLKMVLLKQAYSAGAGSYITTIGNKLVEKKEIDDKIHVEILAIQNTYDSYDRKDITPKIVKASLQEHYKKLRELQGQLFKLADVKNDYTLYISKYLKELRESVEKFNGEMNLPDGDKLWGIPDISFINLLWKKVKEINDVDPPTLERLVSELKKLEKKIADSFNSFKDSAYYEDSVPAKYTDMMTKINSIDASQEIIAAALLEDLKKAETNYRLTISNAQEPIFNFLTQVEIDNKSILDIMDEYGIRFVQKILNDAEKVAEILKLHASDYRTRITNIETMNDPSNLFYYWTGSEYKKVNRVAYYGLKPEERYNTINWRTPQHENDLVGYITKDWRTEIYLQGLLAQNNGTDASSAWREIKNNFNPIVSTNADWLDFIYRTVQRSPIDVDFYFEELDAFWPLIYDLENQKWWGEEDEEALLHQSLTDGNYYLDFIDPATSQLGIFSVSNIGRRTQCTTNQEINCLFEPEIPNLIFISADSDEDYSDLIDECNKLGQPYTQVPAEIYWALSLGGYNNAAFDQVKFELWSHTTYQKTISLTAIPAYYLEPNSRITINDKSTNTYGDFMATNITYNFTPGTGMSLSCSECIQKM